MKYLTEILIIGGGPSAAVTAATARKYYPDKKLRLSRTETSRSYPAVFLI